MYQLLYNYGCKYYYGSCPRFLYFQKLYLMQELHEKRARLDNIEKKIISLKIFKELKNNLLNMEKKVFS